MEYESPSSFKLGANSLLENRWIFIFPLFFVDILYFEIAVYELYFLQSIFLKGSNRKLNLQGPSNHIYFCT